MFWEKSLDKLRKVKKDNIYWYLLFLPFYIIGFYIIERIDIGQNWHEIHCFLDDLIPFNEYFIIPYYSWHVLSVITIFYTLKYEKDNFRKMMRFFIIGAIVSFTTYLVYPSILNLRPQEFARENLMTMLVRDMYSMDTPTNVLPSMHIIGSLGLLFTSWNTRGKDSAVKKIIMLIAVIFICASTMILKQHSILDVIAAIPVSLFGWAVCFNEYKQGVAKKYIRNLFTFEGFFSKKNLAAILFVSPIVFLIFISKENRWAAFLLLVYSFMVFFTVLYNYVTVNRFGKIVGLKWYLNTAATVTYIYIGVSLVISDMGSYTYGVMTSVCALLVTTSGILYANDNLKLHWGDNYEKNRKKSVRTILISAAVIALICYIVR